MNNKRKNWTLFKAANYWDLAIIFKYKNSKYLLLIRLIFEKI